MKFKTGDYAKIIANKSGHNFKIGTVVKLEAGTEDYKAFFDGNYWWVTDNELESVDENRMCKKDLKDGMVVECRNGDRYLVINDKFICNNYWLAISQFADDLSISNDKYTIDKIYQTSGYSFETLFADYLLTCIWEREKPAKEMTIAEIEKELGYKIKVVGNDR